MPLVFVGDIQTVVETPTVFASMGASLYASTRFLTAEYSLAVLTALNAEDSMAVNPLVLTYGAAWAAHADGRIVM